MFKKPFCVAIGILFWRFVFLTVNFIFFIKNYTFSSIFTYYKEQIYIIYLHSADACGEGRELYT